MDARLSVEFPRHPKTKKIVRRLGPAGGYAVVCLILWARSNRPDGDLSGMTSEDIELSVDWTGEPDALVREMADVGFLDGSEKSYRLHDWSKHQPWSAGEETRSLKAKWNAIKRHHGEAEADRKVPEWAAIRSTENVEKGDANSIENDAASNAASTEEDEKPPATSIAISIATEQAQQCTGGARRIAPFPSPSPLPTSKDQSPIGDLSPATAAPLPDDPQSEETDPPGVPPCPVKRIIAAYHEALPELPAVRAFPETAERMLRTRWREEPERQSVEWWRSFFGYVRTCPFLVGGRTDFTADLIWLVRPSNFAKVLNGNYEARKESAHA